MNKVQQGASRLQAELATRILRLLKDQGAAPGHHLVELDLCRQFGVSRTPVRGALRLLAAQGTVAARANRGFILTEAVTTLPEDLPVHDREQEDEALFVAIARARNLGTLADECTQQEVMRQFGAKLAAVIRVMRRLEELGLVERKAGNGWSFTPSINSERAQQDSFAFRRIIEPALLVEPTFELDHDWMEQSRCMHRSFAQRRWTESMVVEFYEINSDFHETLARMSGNRYLHGAIRRQNQLRSFLNCQWIHGHDRVVESIDEHLAILDALEAGRNHEARLLMHDHLESSSTAYRPLEPEKSISEVLREASIA